jgi:hypothetical protein
MHQQNQSPVFTFSTPHQTRVHCICTPYGKINHLVFTISKDSSSDQSRSEQQLQSQTKANSQARTLDFIHSRVTLDIIPCLGIEYNQFPPKFTLSQSLFHFGPRAAHRHGVSCLHTKRAPHAQSHASFAINLTQPLTHSDTGNSTMYHMLRCLILALSILHSHDTGNSATGFLSFPLPPSSTTARTTSLRSTHSSTLTATPRGFSTLFQAGSHDKTDLALCAALIVSIIHFPYPLSISTFHIHFPYPLLS